MNNKIGEINWQSWAYFVATAETGSLNQAADRLQISQSTLSRQLVALEQSLGHSLFNRSTQGVTLTEYGALLLEEATTMQQSADRLQRLVCGERNALSGTIRLSVNEIIAQYYLPKILPKFLADYPDMKVEVEVTNQASNIDKRDADIAVRMFPPTQVDLVSRHLFGIPLGIFASRSYLDTVPTPRDVNDLFELRVLGYDRDSQIEQGARKLGWDVSNEDFKFRCDFMPIQLELARHGGGIVFAHKGLALSLGLTEIDIDVTLPELPVYLVCHRDVQHNKKIRVMMDFLAKYLVSSVS
ncbi:LysR family transcriptional regulator [Vibrio sp. SCSIO 43136]|uniref:LysR family transcriptional regulator n=1 Tax=Vibrio sp. SCSIO 43136 TaxID=2819101 RepID=UPI002075ADDD|nr:LysR family transcriptional regulator [Vibrio sp. SCSIO 43136]USD68028.1 LysR family transcriptional regulator [Vibrio sp. SCSIO 43136]